MSTPVTGGTGRLGRAVVRRPTAERLVADSGLPWTVLRATRFHELPATVFSLQHRLPVTLAVRGFRFQPIDTHDVAARLAELVAAPAGRATDIGVPRSAAWTSSPGCTWPRTTGGGASSGCAYPARSPGSTPPGTI